MLQDEVIQEILTRAMEVQFARIRPAVRHFFTHQIPPEGQIGSVTIHKWAISAINDGDNRLVVAHLATMAVKDVVAVAAQITGEILFRRTHLLPYQPSWEDGLPLFEEGERFGTRGGNVIKSGGCLMGDVSKAAARLAQLDEEYASDERLQLFCAKPLEKELIRAAAKARVPCRVFGVYNHKAERSWVLMRDESACSMLIGRPNFDLPVKASKIIVGAKFQVWINDPRYAVCVTP